MSEQATKPPVRVNQIVCLPFDLYHQWAAEVIYIDNGEKKHRVIERADSFDKLATDIRSWADEEGVFLK